MAAARRQGPAGLATAPSGSGGDMDPLDPQSGGGGDPSLFWNDLGTFGDSGLENLW